MVRGVRYMEMNCNLLEEIEYIRELLNQEAEQNVFGENCYQISVQLDDLIAAYITNEQKQES